MSSLTRSALRGRNTVLLGTAIIACTTVLAGCGGPATSGGGGGVANTVDSSSGYRIVHVPVDADSVVAPVGSVVVFDAADTKLLGGVPYLGVDDVVVQPADPGFLEPVTEDDPYWADKSLRHGLKAVAAGNTTVHASAVVISRLKEVLGSSSGDYPITITP